MEILFVSSELAPQLKVGGLGDVVFGLSRALKNLGHRVTVALPRYPAIEQSGILLARRLTPLPLPPLPGQTAAAGAFTEATLYDARLGSGVELLLIDAAAAGTSLYAGVGSEPGAIYEPAGSADVATRFGVLCRAVVELVRKQAAAGQPYDVVHLHDWPAAMVAYLMRLYPELEAQRVLLTVHNAEHQGRFEGAAATAALAALGLGADHFTPAKLEFYGGVSFLKGGILAADAVTTVSETYARELLQDRGAKQSMAGVLGARPTPPLGILNGVDYAIYNPATDAGIAARYDADDPSNKGRCKSALLAELGLEIAPARPLFASLGRVVHQKGADLLAAALPRILKADVSVVVAGAGDPALEQDLRAALERYPERTRYLGHVPEAMAHKLLAAADFFLMPSRYEPCGLVQLHAQRYGALPVATRTGGFIDTIVDLDAHLETGTGFLFELDPSAGAGAGLVGAVGRAVTAYHHPRLEAVRRRVMRLDLGWERPARRYVQLYKQLGT